MFENLMDPKEIRSALTDAGHTVAGFAALAAKKATEVRSDFAKRYEAQVSESRKVALDVVTRLEGARSAFDAKVEPVVAKVTDRLPEPAQKIIADMAEARKSFQVKAHEFVVKAITVEIPTMKTPAAKTSTAKTSTAKTSTAKTSTAKATAPKARKVASKSATRSVATAKATAAKAKASTAKATRTPRAARARTAA